MNIKEALRSPKKLIGHAINELAIPVGVGMVGYSFGHSRGMADLGGFVGVEVGKQAVPIVEWMGSQISEFFDSGSSNNREQASPQAIRRTII
jgi:hypothetical protein